MYTVLPTYHRRYLQNLDDTLHLIDHKKSLKRKLINHLNKSLLTFNEQRQIPNTKKVKCLIPLDQLHLIWILLMTRRTWNSLNSCPPCKSDNDDQVLVHDSVCTIPNINEPTIKHILFVREAIEEC